MKRKKNETPTVLSEEEWQNRSLERFKPFLDEQQYELQLEELRHPLLPTIRLNPLKMDLSTAKGMAERYHWEMEPISFCPTGFRIHQQEGSTPVSQTLEHRMGHYYIQEAASMLPVELFHFGEGSHEICLDLAASPGGKTTHLVARGMDQNLVIANDSSAGRIPALNIVLHNWGAVNTAITQFPGEKYGMWYPETFDRVLIDAPCSMQGLRTLESHEIRPVTEKEITALAKRQVNLLVSALQAVKVGGEVVYSTCTLVPEEDEAVIDSVLGRFGQAVEVLTTNLSAPGITTNGSRKYNHEVQKSLRLWPSRFHTAGFFACLLQKRQPLDLPSQPAPSRPFEKTGFFQMREKETQRIHAALYAGFQFNLKSVLEKYDLELVGYKQKRYAFPRRLMSDFISLPVQSAGLLIGEESEEGFIPSHEWVSRFFDLFPANRVELSEDQMIHWLNGEDYYGHVDSSPAGTVCLIVDPSGRFLGRGKISGSRIRNMLPHRLV